LLVMGGTGRGTLVWAQSAMGTGGYLLAQAWEADCGRSVPRLLVAACYETADGQRGEGCEQGD
jgi:hypothetical protein